MPFDGAGNYTRNFPAGGWQGDAAAGIKIKADRHDQHDADLAAALSNALCKDGQSSPTADIKMNGKKIINLGAPVASTDAATKGYTDALRSFNSAISITGIDGNGTITFSGTQTPPPDASSRMLGLRFNQANLFFGVRPAAVTGAGDMFVWNNKSDGTGTYDLLTLTDGGYMTLDCAGDSGGFVIKTNMPAAGSAAGPIFVLSRQSTGISATNNGLATIYSNGFNSANEEVTYGSFAWYATDATANSHEGSLSIRVAGAGSNTTRMAIGPTNINIYTTLTTSSNIFSANTIVSGGTSPSAGGVEVASMLRNDGTVLSKKTGTGSHIHYFMYNNADVAPKLIGTLATAGGYTILGNEAGGAGILLRPSAYTSTTGQVTITPAGDMTVAGDISTPGLLRLTNTADVSETSTGHAFQIGPTSGVNLRMDSNEILGVNNGVASAFYINGCTMRADGGINTTGPSTIIDLTVSGDLECTGSFTSGGAVYLSSSTTGTIYLRPNGVSVATLQMSYNTSGDLATGGDITAGAQIMSPVGHGIFGYTSASSAGTVACCVNANDGTFTSRKTGTTNQAHYRVYNNIASAGGSYVGSITSSGITTSYNTSSDETLKEGVTPYSGEEAIAIIRADPPQTWVWKTTGEADMGWLAQKSHSVHPGLATHVLPTAGGKTADGKITEAEPEWWGIDYGRRTPYLWAALTKALDMIDDLTARLTALEGTPA